jgi:multiple sugar transport system substrate-binding protein
MSMKKLSRREFLNLSAFAGASAVLAACGSTAPSAAPTTAPAVAPTTAAAATVAPTTAPAVAPTAAATAAAEVAELRFVWWGGQLRADVTTQVIQLFEQKNPDVKFSFEPLGFEEYWTKMTTQAAGGGLPDVMQHGSPTLVEWTANGFLLPLDSYIDSGVLETKDIPPALQVHGQIDGQIYGMSAGSNANGFVVDVDAFEQAGIPVPADTWTWNDFEQVVLQLHEKLGIWGFGMYLHHIDMWRILYTSAGSELFSPDKKSLAYSDDQPLIDHLNMILRLQEAGAIPTLAEETEVQSQGPESQFIVTGKCAIDWLAGSNQLVAMWTAAGENRNFKILPVPRIAGKQQGTGIRPSQYVAVTNSSKNPEVAVRFLNFFINDVEANTILNAERGVPINSKVLDALSNSAQPAQRAVYDYLARLAEDTAPYSLIPDPLGIEDIRTNIYYPELTDPVRYGMIDPAEAVANFRIKTNEILAASNA